MIIFEHRLGAVDFGIGVVLIVLGLVQTGRFFWSGYLARHEKGIPIPGWLGRALFICGGAWFIYQALK